MATRLPAPVLVLLGSGLTALDAWEGRDAPRLALTLVVLTAATGLCVAAVVRGFGLATLVLLGGCALVISGLPDGTGLRTGGSLVHTAVLLLAAATLRPGRVAWFYVPLVTVLLIERTGGGPGLGVAIDQSVQNVGMVLATSYLVSALESAARTRDAVEKDVAAAELSSLIDDQQAASDRAARRVLHDEVIAALRAVAELPERDDDLVRRACLRAASAVDPGVRSA